MSQYMAPKKIMQINPDHRIVKALETRFKNTEQANASTTKDIVNMLFETSLISSGFGMEDPSMFTKRIHRMLELGLNLEEDDSVEVVEKVEPSQETESSPMEEVD